MKSSHSNFARSKSIPTFRKLKADEITFGVNICNSNDASIENTESLFGRSAKGSVSVNAPIAYWKAFLGDKIITLSRSLYTRKAT